MVTESDTITRGPILGAQRLVAERIDDYDRGTNGILPVNDRLRILQSCASTCPGVSLDLSKSPMSWWMGQDTPRYVLTPPTLNVSSYMLRRSPSNQ